jgi:glycosyltransferase involved in cell wall biosynthesis
MYCVIVSTAYPLRGGIAHFNALLARELDKHHRVETITFKRQYPALLFPGKTQEETGDSVYAPPAPQMIDSINPWSWVQVARELRRRNPDLLIFRYWIPFLAPCFGSIAHMTKRGRRTKALMICDNILPHESRPFDAAFTRYCFRQTDYFIVQSDAVERDLNAFWPGAVYRNVPHPVYSIFGQGMEKEKARQLLGISSERMMLFFGYIRQYKGLHVLLEALAQVVQHVPLQLVVAGEFYDDEEPYRVQIRRLGLEQHVMIHSQYLPNEKVGVFFSAADAVVLPYLSATQSGIIQIAYNFDKPVITTNVGGLAEVVRDGLTGFVVAPENPNALAQAMIRFYRENSEEPFSRHVRTEKGKYSWENFAHAIEDLESSGRSS